MKVVTMNSKKFKNFLKKISLNNYINEVELKVTKDKIIAEGKDYGGMVYFFLNFIADEIHAPASILIKDLKRLIDVIDKFKDESITLILKDASLRIKGKKTITIALTSDDENAHALPDDVEFNAETKFFKIEDDDEKFTTKFINSYDISDIDFKEVSSSYALVSNGNFSKPNFVFLKNVLLIVNEATKESVKLPLNTKFDEQVILDDSFFNNLLKTAPETLIIYTNKKLSAFLIDVGENNYYIYKNQEIGETDSDQLPF